MSQLSVTWGDMNGVNYDSCVGIKYRQFCKTSCYTWSSSPSRPDYHTGSDTLYYCDKDQFLKPVTEDIANHITVGGDTTWTWNEQYWIHITDAASLADGNA